MPTLAEADAMWNRLIEKVGPEYHRDLSKAVAEQIGRNPMSEEEVGITAYHFNRLMDNPDALYLIRHPNMPTRVLNTFRRYTGVPLTPEQEEAFITYLVRILGKVSPSMIPGVVDQVKAERVFPRDLEMQKLLRPYFTKSKEPVSLEAAHFGVSGLASKPGRVGFTRERPTANRAPVRPSGMGERSNAAAVTPDWLSSHRSRPAPTGPAAAGAGPSGGRRKTRRLRRKKTRRTSRKYH